MKKAMVEAVADAEVVEEAIPAHLLLRAMPMAKRQAAIRAADQEIISLLEAVFNAVGIPTEKGWNSVLCLDLENVRQHIINPKKLRPEVG